MWVACIYTLPLYMCFTPDERGEVERVRVAVLERVEQRGSDLLVAVARRTVDQQVRPTDARVGDSLPVGGVAARRASVGSGGFAAVEQGREDSPEGGEGGGERSGE